MDGLVLVLVVDKRVTTQPRWKPLKRSHEAARLEGRPFMRWQLYGFAAGAS